MVRRHRSYFCQFMKKVEEACYNKTAGVITAFAAIILVAMLNNSKRVRERDDDGGDDREESRVRRGFEIALMSSGLS